MNKKLKSFLSALILSTVLSSNFSVLAHTSQNDIQNKKQYLNDERNKLKEIRNKKDELMIRIKELDSNIKAEKFEVNIGMRELNKIKNNLEVIENEIIDLKRKSENNKELFEITKKNTNSYDSSEGSEKDFLDKINKQYTVVQSKIEEYISDRKTKQYVLEKNYLEKEIQLTDIAVRASRLQENREAQDKLLKEIQAEEKLINLDIKNTEESIKEISKSVNNKAEELITYAKSFIGTPYLWGGTRPETGFDCSGYTQYVYARLGIKLGRTTYNQLKDGIYIKKENLKPGDLVFFGSWSNPYHNGIYIGDNKFIHSPKTGDVIKISEMSVMKFLTGVRVMK